jgi:hypothetical protein
MDINFNLLFNYVLPVFILLMIYIFYKYYVKIYYKVREKFSNKNIKLCNDNSCGLGCKKPTDIDNTCPKTIYKDVDGNCHRKCPYVCSNKNENGCKYDECCTGCGYTKIQVPCDLAKKMYDDDSNDDDDDDDDKSDYNEDEPSPNKDKNTNMKSNSKSNNLDNNMTDANKLDDFYKGWSPFVKKWPCSMNVTGTFTECGPYAYNNCNQ